MLKPKTDIVESLKKESKATAIRAERDRLFAETVDKFNSARWESLTENQRKAWKEYRQALCDITKQTTFPESVVYPEMPE